MSAILINTTKSYNAAMHKIDIMKKKGERNLTPKELAELKVLLEATSLYEKSIFE